MPIQYKTCVISAFSGCGKTWLCEHQNDPNLIFHKPYNTITRQLKIKDSDSSQYDKYDGWEKKYVDDLLACNGKYDFVFVTMHDVVLQEMVRRNIPYIMVIPRNYDCYDERERLLIKQQFFGRIALRDNSFLRKDFNQWIEHLSWKYDHWINKETIESYNPARIILLGRENEQYLSDVIGKLFLYKESFPESLCLPTNTNKDLKSN